MSTGKVRIIGGQWRGRKLRVPSLPGLRPTPDRQRETLFNWLSPYLPGAACLDAFAGSGALGFEAASRDAATVLLLEIQPQAAHQLRQQVALFGASQITLLQQDTLSYLRQATPRQFDIVFLDPPFQADLPLPACHLLSEGWLTPGAHLYLEMPRALAESEALPLPAGWQRKRRHLSRETGAWLVQCP